jgi:hypothetical protein
VTLRFRYLQVHGRPPIVTLGGRLVRARPVIAVAVIGPAATWSGDGLVDTGAEDTVFPEWIASRAGIDLTSAPTGTAGGVGTGVYPVRYAEVPLRITDNLERREWRAWVGFTAAPLRRPLLGIVGFLQFYTATFHGDREELELTVNTLYPGT